LLDALPESIAVVRPRAQKLGKLLRDAGCNTVVCKNASEGMGTSLAAGVRATTDADGWIVALADMPFIRPETIRIVTKAIQEGVAIAAPSFHGERGHPVGFARRFLEELSSLRGEDGARQFLKRHPEWVKLLEVDDPGVVRDIDEPSDLER
jgi:molybdenum cofactor cytidylyltransferase